jgi:hypothetical protein
MTKGESAQATHTHSQLDDRGLEPGAGVNIIETEEDDAAQPKVPLPANVFGQGYSQYTISSDLYA